MFRTVIKITLLTRRHPEVTTGRLPLCPIMISCLKVAILYGITARPRSVFFKFFLSTVNCTGVNCVPLVSVLRAIFVWPWNENARTKQKQQTSGDRAIWLVYRTDTNAPCFWSVKRTLGWKLSRNQPILCFDVILQHDWPIIQRLLHLRVFFGGKTNRLCFDLFIHNEHLLKPFFKVIRNWSILCNAVTVF